MACFASGVVATEDEKLQMRQKSEAGKRDGSETGWVKRLKHKQRQATAPPRTASRTEMRSSRELAVAETANEGQLAIRWAVSAMGIWPWRM